MDLFLFFLFGVVVTSEDELRELLESVLADTLPKHLKSAQPLEKPPKEWLSNREAMAFLDASKPTLQRYRSNGTLPYSKIGGKVYYKRADLLRVLREHRVSE